MWHTRKNGQSKWTINPPTFITIFENKLNALLGYDDRLTRFTSRCPKPNVCYIDHKDHLCGCKNRRQRSLQRSRNGWSSRRANMHAGSGDGRRWKTIWRWFSNDVKTTTSPHVGARWTDGTGWWEMTARHTNCIYRKLRTRRPNCRWQILWKTAKLVA